MKMVLLNLLLSFLLVSLVRNALITIGHETVTTTVTAFLQDEVHQFGSYNLPHDGLVRTITWACDVGSDGGDVLFGLYDTVTPFTLLFSQLVTVTCNDTDIQSFDVVSAAIIPAGDYAAGFVAAADFSLLVDTATQADRLYYPRNYTDGLPDPFDNVGATTVASVDVPVVSIVIEEIECSGEFRDTACHFPNGSCDGMENCVCTDGFIQPVCLEGEEDPVANVTGNCTVVEDCGFFNGWMAFSCTNGSCECWPIWIGPECKKFDFVGFWKKLFSGEVFGMLTGWFAAMLFIFFGVVLCLIITCIGCFIGCCICICCCIKKKKEKSGGKYTDVSLDSEDSDSGKEESDDDAPDDDGSDDSD